MAFYSVCVNGTWSCTSEPDCIPTEGVICPNNLTYIEESHCEYTCDYYVEGGCNFYALPGCGCLYPYVLSDDVSDLPYLPPNKTKSLEVCDKYCCLTAPLMVRLVMLAPS